MEDLSGEDSKEFGMARKMHETMFQWKRMIMEMTVHQVATNIFMESQPMRRKSRSWLFSEIVKVFLGYHFVKKR